MTWKGLWDKMGGMLTETPKAIPVVYTILHCPACEKLRETWGAQGVDYEERRVDESQDLYDEALEYGSAVPIIVYPDGRVEEGKFQGVSG